MKIIVIGAGAWGTALANLLAETEKNNVCVIANNAKIADEINKNRTNSSFLPTISLHKNLRASVDLAGEIADADYVFVVTPSIALHNLFEQISQLHIKNSCGFVLASKGLDHVGLRFLHEVFEEKFPQKNYALLSGPNFAAEVAACNPTVTDIAAKNKNFADEIIALLRRDYFRSFYSPSLVSVELCAIVKNIIAIGCGIIAGLELGENARASLVLQGICEIETLSAKFGDNLKLNSPAGFGDIFLTCATTKSRNNSLGNAIGKGESPASLLRGSKTYEGALSAISINKLAQRLELKLILCQTIADILQNEYSLTQIKEKIIAVILR